MSAAALLALALLVPPQDPEAFDAGLTKVRAQMERRQWDKAYDALRALLDANESAAWVALATDSIREDMKRIVFWRGRAEPDPATLVAGELKKYKDGKLDVIFQGRDLRDWDVLNEYYAFPVLFDGPYTVTIKLRNHPDNGPVSLVLGATQDPWVRVSCGLQSPEGVAGFYPAAVDLMSKGRELETLDENREHQLEPAMPIEFKLEVTTYKITLAHNGKKVLDAKRPKMEFGIFAFYGVPAGDMASAEIRIAGEVQPAWMQNKVDAALQTERDRFDLAYEESLHLPAWLLAGSAAAREAESAAGTLKPRLAAPAAAALRPYPGPELAGEAREAYAGAIDKLRELETTGGAAGQRAHLGQLEADGALPPLLIHFLLLRIAEESGLAEETLKQADLVLQEDPAHLLTRRARARALAQLGRPAEAQKLWDAAVAEFAADEALVAEYVRFLLDRNQIPRASEVVQAASAADPELRSRMEHLRKRLAMAEKGPSFAKTYEYVSEHYVVQSDISKEICYEAGQLLEKAYTSYSIHLRRVGNQERTRFRVYVFSGEASYHRYTDEAFGGRMENSAGVYSPEVKQLLIWNLPDPAARLRTTVHEGFHQYLDAVTRGAPVWFNEGLAEYYELAETKDGRFQTGQINRDHLAQLKRDGVEPLVNFVRFNDALFRAKGQETRNYAQGWAFVHFLQHGTREQRAIFDTLFRLLGEGATPGSAVFQAFEGVDFDALDAAFLAHVDGLRKG